MLDNSKQLRHFMRTNEVVDNEDGVEWKKFYQKHSLAKEMNQQLAAHDILDTGDNGVISFNINIFESNCAQRGDPNIKTSEQNLTGYNIIPKKMVWIHRE